MKNIKHDYCKGTDEEKEEWIVLRIRSEFRNMCREVVGIPIKEKEDEVKEKKDD